MHIGRSFAAAAFFCGAALVGSTAQASVALSDSFAVYDGNHKLVGLLTQPEDASESASNVVFGLNVAYDPSQIGHATILIEPQTGLESDIAGICIGCGPNGGFGFGFVSDTETAPASFGDTNPRILPERGPVNMTYVLAPDLRAQGWTAVFTSDSEVPEPGTWALMLIGLGAVGGALRAPWRTRAHQPA